MKRIFTAIFFTLLIGNSYGQRVEEQLFDMLQQGQYRELVNKVCALREKEYYKNAFMDYCLTYGYCKLNQPAFAREWFDHILASYNNLSGSKRTELKNLKQSCSNSNTAGSSTNKLFEFLQSMSAEGFEGNSTGIESKMGVPSISDTVKEFDFENLTFDTQNRQFNLQQKVQALSYYKNLIADKNIKSDTSEHFVVFFPDNAMAIKNHMKKLEEYYAYYSQAFNLTTSNRLIVIFYCTSRSDFNYVAEKIHKIPVPKSTFGYASSVDLVMLGIANMAWLGAMKHELFHLMIRSYLGDIPAWLDEGSACFFESSSLKNGVVTTNFSRSNYRLNLLHNLDEIKAEVKRNNSTQNITPFIKDLLHYNWQQFSGTTGDLMIKASVHQSLSYAFITFLHEKNLLVNTIRAFRYRAYSSSKQDENTDGLTLLRLHTTEESLKEATNMQPDEVYASFYNWCVSKGIRLN